MQQVAKFVHDNNTKYISENSWILDLMCRYCVDKFAIIPCDHCISESMYCSEACAKLDFYESHRYDCEGNTLKRDQPDDITDTSFEIY
jgi:hypothetical protein